MTKRPKGVGAPAPCPPVYAYGSFGRVVAVHRGLEEVALYGRGMWAPPGA